MSEFNPDKSFLREAATILAVRYIAAALFALLFYFVLPFPLEIRQVLAIVAFAPGSAMSPAFTEKLKGNAALASVCGQRVDPDFCGGDHLPAGGDGAELILSEV